VAAGDGRFRRRAHPRGPAAARTLQIRQRTLLFVDRLTKVLLPS
jgi:hypothetical protein